MHNFITCPLKIWIALLWTSVDLIPSVDDVQEKYNSTLLSCFSISFNGITKLFCTYFINFSDSGKMLEFYASYNTAWIYQFRWLTLMVEHFFVVGQRRLSSIHVFFCGIDSTWKAPTWRHFACIFESGDVGYCGRVNGERVGFLVWGRGLEKKVS